MLFRVQTLFHDFGTQIKHIRSESDFDKSLLNARYDRIVNEGPSIVLGSIFSILLKRAYGEMRDLFFASGQFKKTFVFGPSTSNELTCMSSRLSIKVAKSCVISNA